MNTCLLFILAIFGSITALLFVDIPISNDIIDADKITRGDVDAGKITLGSSLSFNDTNPDYWHSPSGTIAFGFYQLPWSPNRYTVGMWFAKSSRKTLIWSTNHKIPLHKPSSILFTKEGKFVLRIIPDNKEEVLLPGAVEPVSYGRLHDNGNFVLYGSDSQIVWESFDHPADTILGGQKLRLGVHHLISHSGEFKLSMDKTSGLVIITNAYEEFQTRVSNRDYDTPPPTPPSTLNLDTTGSLYLVNSDGSIREVIYKDENQQPKLQEEDDMTSHNVNEDYIFRATLDSRGEFNLYKERIGGNVEDNEESSSSLVLLWTSNHWDKYLIRMIILCVFAVPIFVLVVACNAAEGEKLRKKRIAEDSANRNQSTLHY